MNIKSDLTQIPGIGKNMDTDADAKAFFESLTHGYKRDYCDWIGGANTKQTRAGKSLIML